MLVYYYIKEFLELLSIDNRNIMCNKNIIIFCFYNKRHFFTPESLKFAKRLRPLQKSIIRVALNIYIFLYIYISILVYLQRPL